MNFQNTEIHQLKVQILLHEPLFAENQNKVCVQTISTIRIHANDVKDTQVDNQVQFFQFSKLGGV